MGQSRGAGNCPMTGENDRIIVRRDIFNGRGDLSMHGRAARGRGLVYDAGLYKHSQLGDTDIRALGSDTRRQAPAYTGSHFLWPV